MLEARGFVYRKYEATSAIGYLWFNEQDGPDAAHIEQLDRLAGIWYEEDVRAGRVPKEAKAAQEVA
jgi:hypothetical protein